MIYASGHLRKMEGNNDGKHHNRTSQRHNQHADVQEVLGVVNYGNEKRSVHEYYGRKLAVSFKNIVKLLEIVDFCLLGEILLYSAVSRNPRAIKEGVGAFVRHLLKILEPVGSIHKALILVHYDIYVLALAPFGNFIRIINVELVFPHVLLKILDVFVHPVLACSVGKVVSPNKESTRLVHNAKDSRSREQSNTENNGKSRSHGHEFILISQTDTPFPKRCG